MILSGIKLAELVSGAAKKWLNKQMDSPGGSVGASIDREKGEATFFQGSRKGEFKKKAGGSLEYMGGDLPNPGMASAVLAAAFRRLGIS